MFKFILNDDNKYIETTFNTADEVAEFTYNTTGLWMLAKHVNGVCQELESGKRWEQHDVGITIIRI